MAKRASSWLAECKCGGGSFCVCVCCGGPKKAAGGQPDPDIPRQRPAALHCLLNSAAVVKKLNPPTWAAASAATGKWRHRTPAQGATARAGWLAPVCCRGELGAAVVEAGLLHSTSTTEQQAPAQQSSRQHTRDGLRPPVAAGPALRRGGRAAGSGKECTEGQGRESGIQESKREARGRRVGGRSGMERPKDVAMGRVLQRGRAAKGGGAPRGGKLPTGQGTGAAPSTKHALRHWEGAIKASDHLKKGGAGQGGRRLKSEGAGGALLPGVRSPT